MLSDHLYTGLQAADGAPALYEPLLQSHLDWLRETRNAVPSTVRSRSRYVGRFLEWLGPDATVAGLQGLTAQRIEKYVLEQSQRNGSSGCSSMRTPLRMFLRFCYLKGYTQQPLDQAVPTVRHYQLAHAPRGLTDEQARRVLEGVDHSTPIGRRDYAILQMLYTYGVRAGQVRKLRLTDVDWQGNSIFFRAMKMGDDIQLPLTESVGESLLDYLQYGRPSSARPEVFLSVFPPFPPIMTPSGLTNIAARHIRAAGIEGQWGTHCFRHCFATRLLASGHSLKAIADMIGHRLLASTFIYTKVDFNALREAALEWPEEVR
jgi:integrase/recombinase XerD